MRLINSSRLTLSEFVEPNNPDYAILLHSRSVYEASFQEFVAKSSPQKSGFRKIQEFCNL
ncbi:hypothetical protein K469DRAFT_719936 [Zopfia rhizophila CBS 207.26]|uniref:Uncharacterized protein n=1 Tax=Zopfia rhizophila CBS 207.26 TaxID=1314779 RepID=A0A6A6EM34_9PEZI|nr:hypothetical protein K469DRAFT_719936 [Zopfia rhizophila CBS 207.26]